MSNYTFLDVTEKPGEPVTAEQIRRLYSRYHWARGYCADKEVLEVACGTGLGIRYLQRIARSVKGGDASPEVYNLLKARLGHATEIRQFAAERMPYPNRSFDVVILFEALYYLDSPEAFVLECKRVLRPGGVVLISTANKDLYDFTPSIFAKRYFGVVELRALFEENKFSVEFFGDSPVAEAGPRQRLLRPVKMAATKLGLVPKTMHGKRFLKRLVFGALHPMPDEIDDENVPNMAHPRLSGAEADVEHRIVFCAAHMS